jgi:hypothetical protein
LLRQDATVMIAMGSGRTQQSTNTKRAYPSQPLTVIAVCQQQDVGHDGAVARTSAAIPRPLK